MNYKIDENLPSETTEVLASAGFGCDSVSDEGLAGAEDTALAEAIAREPARELRIVEPDRIRYRTE